MRISVSLVLSLQQRDAQFVGWYVRSVGIDGRSPLQQVMRDFDAVDDDEIFAKQLGVYQATWMKNSG